MQLIKLHFELDSPFNHEKSLKVVSSLVDEKTAFTTLATTGENGIFLGTVSHSETEIQFNIRPKALAITSTTSLTGRISNSNEKSKIIIDIAPWFYIYILILVFTIIPGIMILPESFFVSDYRRNITFLIYFGGLFLLILIIYGLYRLEARAAIKLLKEKFHADNSQ